MAQVVAVGRARSIDGERRLQDALILAAVAAGLALRWVGLGGSMPTYDETFAAAISRLPIGSMLDELRAIDWHPPLDYLMRRPFADTGSAFWLRAPSAVVASVTLLAVAAWMRRSGWLGVAVVTLTSFSSLQLLYGRTARMYAILILGGTILAIVSDRWLLRPRPQWAVAAGAALLVTALAQQVVLFMVPGLLLLAGLRRDRDVWVWRASVLGGVAVWAAVWGPSLLDQLRVPRVSWIPLTTPSGALEAISGQLTLSPTLHWLVLIGTITGGVLLVRRHPRLGHVWLCVLVLPALLVMVAGLEIHVLLPRAVSFVAVAPVLSLAAIVEWLVVDPPVSLGRVVAVPAAVAVLIAGSASTVSVVTFEEASTGVRNELRQEAVPGDAIGILPAFLAPMLQWDHDLAKDPPPAAGLAGESNLWSATLPGASPTGRLFVVVPDTYGYQPPPTFRSCPGTSPSHRGDLSLRCYVAANGSTDGG